MSLSLRQEQFVDDKTMRDKHIGKVDVLQKVKTLTLLSDNEHMTMKMVAKYYEVGEITLRQIRLRHREELDADGLRLVKGTELMKLKSTLLQDVTDIKAPSLLVVPKRAILRIGMLLRDSEVAKQVRTYLLNIEEESTQEQKTTALNRRVWDGLDMQLLDIITVEVMQNSGTLTSACEIASDKLGRTVSACMGRYSSHIKKMIQNKELISRIEGNRGRGRHLRLVDDGNTTKQNSIPDSNGIRQTTIDELYFNAVVQGIVDIENHIKKMDSKAASLLESENSLLKSRVSELEETLRQSERKYTTLLKKYRIVQDELKSTRAVISASINIKVNEELGNTFRMDRNGNLERI